MGEAVLGYTTDEWRLALLEREGSVLMLAVKDDGAWRGTLSTSAKRTSVALSGSIASPRTWVWKGNESGARPAGE